MKKNILSFTAIALIASAAIFTGCKKDDTTPPVVTLTGPATQIIPLQGTYTELGATAEDDKDGAITPTISGSVNTDLTGTYVITYMAMDAAGNEGTATRTITVINEAAIYAGNYKCTDPAFGSLSPWFQSVTASTTLNKHIIFGGFAARSWNNTIEAVLTGGTAFTLVPATVTGGTSGCTFAYTANGSGLTISQTAGIYTFSVKYFEEGILGGTGCSAVPATAFEDTFVKQ